MFSPSPTKGKVREQKRAQWRRQLERHLKMCFRVSVIIHLLFQIVWLGKFLLTILELN